MVFAKGKPIKVYGEGKGTVTVELDGNKKSVICKNGKWLAELEPMEYGGPYAMMVEFENRTVLLEDIYVNGTNIDFKNCNFSKLGTTALKMIGGVSDCDIVGNEFYDNSAGAIVLGQCGYKIDYG